MATEYKGNAISLLVIEEYSDYKNGIAELLAAQVRYIKSARNVRDAVVLLRKEEFDILLLDADHYEDLLAEITENLSRLNLRKKPRLVVMSSFTDNLHVMRAYAAGIHGYVIKDSFIRELSGAFGKISNGEYYFSPPAASTLLNALVHETRPPELPEEALSDQEKKVLFHICRQLGNAEIARELSLAEYTIMRHKQNIKEKIGAKNLVGYVTYALKHNIVRLSDL